MTDLYCQVVHAFTETASNLVSRLHKTASCFLIILINSTSFERTFFAAALLTDRPESCAGKRLLNDRLTAYSNCDVKLSVSLDVCSAKNDRNRIIRLRL